jgi:hypothetical protein
MMATPKATRGEVRDRRGLQSTGTFTCPRFPVSRTLPTAWLCGFFVGLGLNVITAKFATASASRKPGELVSGSRGKDGMRDFSDERSSRS